jgi:predicted ATP-grasp superfamily ATP-dependent carboligase
LRQLTDVRELGGARPRVLITSGQERFALGACRSLAAAGYRVTAVADQTPAATHWSRMCSARHVLVDPKVDADGFVDGLVEIVREIPHDAVLPATDAALLAVSARRERLEQYVELKLPPHDVVLAATDKIALHEAAGVAGLAAPETVVCESREAGWKAAQRLGLPVIVKPRRTASEVGRGIRQRESVFVDDQSALEAVVGEFGTPYLLQRPITGHVMSVGGMRTPDDGMLGFSTSTYVRTWPPHAGNVAFARTIEPPAGLRERVERLASHIGWHGVFELEVIASGTGDFYAIDLNPRIWGSIAHASRAGAPMAVLFCDWALGRRPPPVTARPGVLYRWEDADARNAVRALRQRRMTDACRIVRPRRKVAHAYFRWDDPGPLLARAILLATGRSY